MASIAFTRNRKGQQRPHHFHSPVDTQPRNGAPLSTQDDVGLHSSHPSQTKADFDIETAAANVDKKKSTCDTLSLVENSRGCELRSDDDCEEKNEKRYGLKYFRILLTKLSSKKKSVSIIVCFVFLAYAAICAKQKFTTFRLNEWMANLFGGIENHRLRSLCFLVCLVAAAVVCLLPATPFAVSAGLLFSKALGYVEGIIAASVAVWLGTAIGYAGCFFLGRYFLKDSVKRLMLRKYPIFEVIDIAISDSAFLVMSLLHLTPVMPFGPVSYMSGGITSIPFSKFIISHIVSIPHYVFFVFLGASTNELVSKGKIEEGNMHIIFNVVLSLVVLAVISVIVKKKLKRVLDHHQKKCVSVGEIQSN